ncbi:hypothetical protein DFP73DRAFT_569978 [Morchella snyderi]|nr:hypothetical protein DFP73DRAFT_569978 [Morchella snyderi]
MSETHLRDATLEDSFFNTIGRGQWSFEAFKVFHGGCTGEELSEKWVRELRATITDNTRSAITHKTALKLLNKHLSTATSLHQPSPPASITIHGSTIHGSNNFSSNNQPTSVSHGRRRKRKAQRGLEPPIKRLARFRTKLANVTSEWTLDPDRASVEKRLAQYVSTNNTRETPAHSLIIDTGDKEIKQLFEPHEWSEILAVVPPLPEPERMLISYLEIFLKTKNVDEVHDILERGAYVAVPPGLGVLERRRTYKHLVWAHHCISCIIHDYETGHIAFQDNRERWYQTHIWTPLIDRLFEYIPDVRFISGECPTVATASRKNPKRQSPGSRRNPGCLHDGVLKYGDYEIGAVENGGCNITPNTEKWTNDTLKLAKSSRDMIVKYHSLLGGSGSRIPALGIVTGGLSLETLRTCFGGGSVCVLVHDPVISLPTLARHFGPIVEAIVHMWRIKVPTHPMLYVTQM